jgi:predicted nucleic acid-binding protein
LTFCALSSPRSAFQRLSGLDAGEAEAIALATEIPADVLLIDEKEGRSQARQAGFFVASPLEAEVLRDAGEQ